MRRGNNRYLRRLVDEVDDDAIEVEDTSFSAVREMNKGIIRRRRSVSNGRFISGARNGRGPSGGNHGGTGRNHQIGIGWIVVAESLCVVSNHNVFNSFGQSNGVPN